MNRCKMLTGAGVALSLSLLAGCGAARNRSPPARPRGRACPQEPVRVVVSVNQWADIVKQLGGSCTDVTTVIANAAADPHDYEPTAADIARLGDAQLVVVNGADYDTWATKAVDALPQRPPWSTREGHRGHRGKQPAYLVLPDLRDRRRRCRWGAVQQPAAPVAGVSGHPEAAVDRVHEAVLPGGRRDQERRRR